MNRTDQLARLETEFFDLVIIGGGASGAGAALDAALRGLKVALVEADDFAAATSSKSTKLIHGGVRYLEEAFKNLDFGQLRQVKHGLAERWTLIRNAPFLAHPLALVTPCFSWFEGLYFSIGLKIYDFIAGPRDPLPKSRWLSKKATLERLPSLAAAKIHSSVLYFDGQFDDARYCLTIVKTAAERGAVVCNHLKINAFQKNEAGKLIAAEARDTLSGKTFSIKSRLFLNCTGPASDSIRRLANPNSSPRIAQSKGAHILLPLDIFAEKNQKSALETAFLIPKTTDGRVVFAIPFLGKLMVGTTDTPVSELSEPFLEKKEADFLLENLNRYLEKPVAASQIEAGFAGLRPLILDTKKKATKTLVRDHEVEWDELSGLVSLLGGKWTTYRLMAQDALDFCCKLLKINVLCTTANQLLAGAENFSFEKKDELKRRFQLDDDVAEHLLKSYGSRAERVGEWAFSKNMGQRIVAGWPFIAAEIAYQIQEEMACTLRDILARRLRLELLDWSAAKVAAPVVAEILATELGWSAAEKTAQLADYQRFLDEMSGRFLSK